MKTKPEKNAVPINGIQSAAPGKRAASIYLHKGPQYGKAKLKPAVQGQTAGRYLQILQEDRGVYS